MIKIIIGIDDTDNAYSKGTGSIATEMTEIIESKGWGTCDTVTRHQLYLHPDIAYTSHNSSMIFTANVNPDIYEELKETLTSYLEKESAEGSDPAICIGEISKIKCKEELIEFGYSAKRQVRTKEEAYNLADKCNLYLREVGGEGIGVIGAIAGVALRYEGNDGEVKGGIEQYTKGDLVPVSDFLKEKNITKVCSKDLKEVPKDTVVKVKWKVKPIISEGLPILLVDKDEKGQWTTLNKDGIREFGEVRTSTAPCDEFEKDVVEELIEHIDNSCFNCRYRRWTDKAFTCMKGRR